MNLHRVLLASAFIMTICSTVQVTDCVGWMLVELVGIKSVDRLRLRVNDKKDEIEERCTRAADGLIKSTHAMAVFVARSVRDGDGHGKLTAAPLGPWEKRVLRSIDSTGHLARGSPLKVMVATLNLLVAADGLRAENVEKFMTKLTQSPLKMPSLGLPSWRSIFGRPSIAGEGVWIPSAREARMPRNASGCRADEACQVLSGGRVVDKGACPAGTAWYPTANVQKDHASSVTIRYKKRVLAARLAVHFQLRFEGPLEDNAAVADLGQEPPTNFAVRVDVGDGIPYLVNVSLLDGNRWVAQLTGTSEANATNVQLVEGSSSAFRLRVMYDVPWHHIDPAIRQWNAAVAKGRRMGVAAIKWVMKKAQDVRDICVHGGEWTQTHLIQPGVRWSQAGARPKSSSSKRNLASPNPPCLLQGFHP